MRHHRTGRRLLEDERRRQLHTREEAQPRGELRRRQRVDTRLHQRRVGG